MLVFVLNQAQKANTGKIQTPVYENVREFGPLPTPDADLFSFPCFQRGKADIMPDAVNGFGRTR